MTTAAGGPPRESSDRSVLEAALARDRAIVITALTIVIVLSWIHILLGAGMGMTAFEMSSLSSPGHGSSSGTDPGMMAMMSPATWTAEYAALMFWMWWIMMVAMMLPSAAPMILLFARVQRTERRKGAPFVPTGVFAAGYIAMWGLFSVVATLAQWGLERRGLLSSMMASNSARFAGALILAAGLYQLTPWKRACLGHCRSPLRFISQRWRTGTLGAFRMGVDHGTFCLACCWFLMALLFAGGVMNLYWIAGLAIFVLLEKTVPPGRGFEPAAGIGLIAWGGWLILAAP